MIGKTLCHYEILEMLGAGGMGEVFRAVDTKLGREVAIKIIPEALTASSDLLVRFEREARALAAVDHANVAAIYSFETAELTSDANENPRAVRFLVMQLAEGKTLDALIARGPIPVDRAIVIAQQIAEALESAHEKGIIHRDLKPGNVKVDADDRVKVLDFGLAKFLEVAEPFAGSNSNRDPSDLSQSSPTLKFSQLPTTSGNEATREGMLLGTAAYMSPEQARGLPADQRSDIWAFGCVLYEMLTGQRVFGGETLSDRLAQILEREPDWQQLPELTPAPLRTLVRLCLAKDPKRRLHDMTDVRLWLEELPHLEATTGQAPEHVAPWRVPIPWTIALISVLGALWIFVYSAPEPLVSPVTRLALQTEPLALGTHPCSSIIELSPDGRTLAYLSGDGGTGQLYLRHLDSPESVPVAGAEEARSPFFSPDGQWLAFEAEGELRKVRVDGGKVWPICKAELVHGASWGSDGTIIFGDPQHFALSRVSADGGEPEVILAAGLARNELFLSWPQLLPGGRSVVFTSLDGAGFSREIALLNLDSGRRATLVEGAGNARYLHSGHLAYPLNGSLMIVPFDAEEGSITGDPTSAIDGLLMGFPSDPPIAHYSVADNGTLAFVAGPDVAVGSQLVRIGRDGSTESIGAEQKNIRGPRFSPDGRRIAVSPDVGDLIAQIWVHDLDRSTFTRLTFEGQGWWPLWTPDGERLVFTHLRPGEEMVWNLYWIPADGSASPELLVQSELGNQATSISRDGNTLILHQNEHPETGWDVMMFRLGDESQESQPLLNTPFNEALAELSPDGRWLAYSSNESGRFEVYVRSYPDLDKKWQISTDGGIEPAWSPDGTELFFRDEEGLRLMATEVVLEPQFQPGRPELLVQGSFAGSPGYGRNYDVAPDAESFLMVKQELKGVENANIQVVLNWLDEVLELTSPQSP